MLNIILGGCAAILWLGTMGWYFKRDFKGAWDSYRRRWTTLHED